MPGMVAFAIPVLWLWQAGRLHPAHPLSLVVLAAGTVGLLWCVRDFYVQGKGTLAPWSPTQNLVVVGLYRYSRNPMYVSVLLILIGWAAAFAASGIFFLCGHHCSGLPSARRLRGRTISRAEARRRLASICEPSPTLAWAWGKIRPNPSLQLTFASRLRRLAPSNLRRLQVSDMRACWRLRYCLQ